MHTVHLCVCPHCLDARLARIEQVLESITRAQTESTTMAQVDIDRMLAAVERSSTVSESAVALITGLAEQIRVAAGDTAAMQSLADTLDAQATTLAAAVTANTPDPAPAPAPEPTTP